MCTQVGVSVEGVSVAEGRHLVGEERLWRIRDTRCRSTTTHQVCVFCVCLGVGLVVLKLAVLLCISIHLTHTQHTTHTVGTASFMPRAVATNKATTEGGSQPKSNDDFRKMLLRKE